MRAVILAGGKGTRLRPYTMVLPKPLVPVGDHPILERILRQLRKSGFDRVDLCVGYHADLLRAYFSQDQSLPDGLQLEYSYEREPLGTVGALALIEKPDEPFLVMNGDILTDLDYADFMRHHRDSGAKLSIATYAKTVDVSLGVIEEDSDRVTGYREKPSFDFRVSMGIYAYDPSVLERLDGGRLDFPDLVNQLVDEGEKVATYPFDGRWYDIGTMSDYQAALEEIERDPAFGEA